jgi:hypothetical protein
LETGGHRAMIPIDMIPIDILEDYLIDQDRRLEEATNLVLESGDAA